MTANWQIQSTRNLFNFLLYHFHCDSTEVSSFKSSSKIFSTLKLKVDGNMAKMLMKLFSYVLDGVQRIRKILIADVALCRVVGDCYWESRLLS